MSTGLSVRILKTKIVADPTPHEVNELDGDGNEIVLHEIHVPRDIEAEGGKAVEAYVAAETEKWRNPPAETTSHEPTPTPEE